MSTNIIRDPHSDYRQRSVEIPSGSRILYISGQTATDENGHTPPDAETQADIVFGRIVESLHDAGMEVGDIVKTNVYLTNPDDITAIYAAGGKHFGGHVAAGTLVYVSALALPEVLLELEAVAAKQD